MATQKANAVQRFRSLLCLYKSKFNQIANKVANFETPERFKGTFLERWGKYWRNLYIDYRDVAIDITKDCKDRPIRASIYFSFLGGLYYLSKHNPDEVSFRDAVIQNASKLVQVGEMVRNPASTEHLMWIEQCYNERTIRCLNLGIMSLIWVDNYDKMCALYKATCPYLQPRYITFHQRIIDVGFLDRWWILEDKMKDYDVNEAQFQYLSILPSNGQLLA
ncbi:mitochondrial import inner membrane translocase subunit Tim29 [Orussus abietinus]|uniref:mitochondrial import inner membrane translocase subunit Tim29 n=1 Tax=Orussus abietinus TaxID=222816 RepID=UPI0006254D92|nr:mitochondrial import inner membrane translocase subunit Tim29 [Orussus abietinus]